jgi:predicted transcriptional regulator
MSKRNTKLTSEEKLKILRLRKEGKTAPYIAKELGRSEIAIRRIFAANKKLLKNADEMTSEDLFGDDLDDFSSIEAVQKSLKRSIRLLEQVLNDAEQNYVIVDERMRRVPLRTLMDCIEKAVKAQTQLDAKGKKSTSDIQVDYKKMAKLYKDSKKDKEYYDSNQHMRDLLNLAHDKIKEKNDD